VAGIPVAVGSLGVVFLDAAAVGKQDATEVGSGLRAVDRPLETVTNEPRDGAAVVDMGVSKKDISSDENWICGILLCREPIPSESSNSSCSCS
jgi:hypothetical protein